MKEIVSEYGRILFGSESYKELNSYINKTQPTKIVIITDKNTSHYCLEYFISKIDHSIDYITTSIPAGEEFKTLDTCVNLWQFLSDNYIDRHALIINLGGGTITDIGGFIAATHQRGISYINIPTSLLAMVDASIGGKTGIDFNGLKNQIGVIKAPEMVVIDTYFLKTLPEKEFYSGIAEILKHGLIASESYWKKITNKKMVLNETTEAIIYESVMIKNNIVQQDRHENGVRKLLNFGHTLGHAIESYFLTANNKILHGEAIAVGMLLAGYISHKTLNFPENELGEITAGYQQYFIKKEFDYKAIKNIIDVMKFDKKNLNGKSQFVLLKKIGEPKIDCIVSEELIFEAFKYYDSDIS